MKARFRLILVYSSTLIKIKMDKYENVTQERFCALLETDIENITDIKVPIGSLWQSIDKGSFNGVDISEVLLEVMKFTKLMKVDNSKKRQVTILIINALIEKYVENESLENFLQGLIPSMIDTFCALAKAKKTMFRNGKKLCCL